MRISRTSGAPPDERAAAILLTSSSHATASRARSAANDLRNDARAQRRHVDLARVVLSERAEAGDAETGDTLGTGRDSAAHAEDADVSVAVVAEEVDAIEL